MRMWAAGVLALVVLGACSGGGGDSPLAGIGGDGPGDEPGAAPKVPEDVAGAMDDAIEATNAVESAKVTILLLTGVGVDPGGAEGSLSADGRAQVLVKQGDDEVEYRSDGETGWVRNTTDEVEATLPDGAVWVEAPRETYQAAGFTREIGETWEPLLILRGLGDVEDLGVDDVDGTEVRLLRGEIDFDAALDAASDEERQDLEESFTVDDPDGTEIVAEVGLDGDGRVRKLEVEISDSEGFGAVTMMLQVQAFNQSFEVPEPSGDETVHIDDAPEFAALIGAG